jgi:hypothetical protein
MPSDFPAKSMKYNIVKLVWRCNGLNPILALF